MRHRMNILITGASTGIGQALALHFAQQGHEVFAGVRRHLDADALAAQAKGCIKPILLDVTQPASVENAVAAVQALTHGRLDVLINNAGVAFSGPLEMTPHQDLARLMDVNVMGTFSVTRACLPMLRLAHGRIINISSISGVFAAPGLTAYVASKHAVEGLTAALRMELAPMGVKVCSVAPGKIDTPIWGKASHTSDKLLDEHTPELRTLYQGLIRFYKRYALHETSTPLEAVISAVEHAMHSASPKARYIVGRQARWRARLNWLPTHWRESLVVRAMSRAAPKARTI